VKTCFNDVIIKKYPLGGRMTELNEEERKKILESAPVGTWALMVTVGISMVIGWLFLYYGVFLSRGIIN